MYPTKRVVKLSVPYELAFTHNSGKFQEGSLAGKNENVERQRFLKLIQHRPLCCLTAISNMHHISQAAPLINRVMQSVIEGDTTMKVILAQLSVSQQGLRL